MNCIYTPRHRPRTTIATIVPLLKVQGTIHTLTHSRSRCLASPGTSLASSLHTARQRLAKTRVTTPLRIRNYTLTHTSHSQYTHLPAIPCPLVCPLCASRLILFSTLTPLIPPTTLIITKQSTIHLNHARTRPLLLACHARPHHTPHTMPIVVCLPAGHSLSHSKNDRIACIRRPHARQCIIHLCCR